MAAKELPEIEVISRLLDYNSDTGLMTWRERGAEDFSCEVVTEGVVSAWNARFAGSVAGTHDNRGYIRVTIDTRRYLAHRLAWKLVNGAEPEFIDHINGDRTDNRIENLRPVSRTQNNRNRANQHNNKSGVPGVRLRGGHWVAEIKVAGSIRYLGQFDSINEASIARHAAEKVLDYHPNHGRMP